MSGDRRTGAEERRDRVHAAVLDLLDLLAERGDRWGLADDEHLRGVADAVVGALDGVAPDGAAVVVLDALRGALHRADLVEPSVPPSPQPGALDPVTQRLIAWFRADDARARSGDGDVERIRRAVHAEADRFSTVPVRAFVPILIERGVRRRLDAS